MPLLSSSRMRRAPMDPPMDEPDGQSGPWADEPPEGRGNAWIAAKLDEVAELLDVDREYRARAAAGTLPRIAPRRFNPAREAWLPVLHTGRGGRQYTALYSNTARAHELGATGDWVVVYRDDHDGRGLWTVVTVRRGPLAGRRVVRGREEACSELYESERSGESP